MAELTEDEVLRFLYSIEKGEVRLNWSICPQDVYAGNVEYVASNGWKIVIFNDANEWDYIDCIETNDGRQIDYDSLMFMPKINEYYPTDEVSWISYGIPGYLQFRCIACGDPFQYQKDRVFKCKKCAPQL